MTTKKCTKCGIEKPLTEFDKDKSKKDGHASNCKSCKANWRANNKEKLKQVNAEYRAKNKEKIQKQYITSTKTVHKKCGTSTK